MQIKIEEGKFNSSVESLQQYKCPNWFKNAKFGIWAHWGPQCVPMLGDWYARNMYIEGHPMYKYHCEHYGHPSVFGYKDILPLWKAENFDASKLVNLYKKAGAKYIVSCAVHHDNFDCWNSKHNKWNSVNMGPKKDIVGMLKKATDEAGLHFGVTVHHERSYSWFSTNKGCDTEGEFKGVPYDGNDPAYQDFYYEPHDDRRGSYPLHPSYEFVQGWYDRVKDVIDSYNPDLLYTDGGVPFKEVGRSAIANFYNHNMNQNNGELQAVYNCKNFLEYDKIDAHNNKAFHGEFFEGICVEDLERGSISDIAEKTWQTDTCIGQWYYKNDANYKSSAYVVKMLTDIVSKNGNLLLNIPIKPDGTIDDEEVKIIEGIGAWLDVNGEAIYGTTPWIKYGEFERTIEGDEFRGTAGLFRESEIAECSSEYRFTQKGDSVYAVCFGWSEDEFTIKSMGKDVIDVKNVSLLGCDEKLTWEQKDNALIIKTPCKKPCEVAYSFKIEH